MLTHALLAFVAVFICFGGNYLTGQSMLERPLVVGLVTGLLMGDMRQGILMGASLEAIFLGNVNIGGVISAEPVTAPNQLLRLLFPRLSPSPLGSARVLP